MNLIFTVAVSLLITGCAGGPHSISMSVSQDAESQALSESVAWVALRYDDAEGEAHPVMERPVQGVRAGLEADIELPEGLSADEEGHWVATAMDDQRQPLMEGQSGGGEDEVNVELGVIK